MLLNNIYVKLAHIFHTILTLFVLQFPSLYSPDGIHRVGFGGLDTPLKIFFSQQKLYSST